MYNGLHKDTMKSQMLAQPTLIGKYDINLHGEKISYTLKRSSRAKLIWLDIKRQSGLTVTIPHNYSVCDLPDYLNSNSQWILRNFSKYCNDVSASPVNTVRPSHTISYLGKSLKVTQNRTGFGLNAVKLEQNKLIVSLNSSGGNLSSQELEHWLKIQAARMINKKVEEFSQQMRLLYNRVVIRDQKSRWGSCSCLKNLNFNWRLIMAPEPVLDYVIIHELCHLKEMSHSKSFWDLVARYCPQWRKHRSWLDNHCLELNAQIQF
jgi:predicted metal-dependent hydrolase